MSDHTVNHLRAALFKQIGELQNPNRDTGETVARARAVAEVGRTILESAKLEIEHARMVGGTGVPFLGPGESEPLTRQTATGTLERQGNVLRHRLK